MTTPTYLTRPQKASKDDAGVSDTQIYVVTPARLKELGFVTKVERGQTLVVSRRHSNNAAISNPSNIADDVTNQRLLASPGVIAVQTKSPQFESPVHRRVIQGFSKHWITSLEENGFVKCPLRSCTYISIRYEDMCQHYAKCDGRPNNSAFFCSVCNCCLGTQPDLVEHVKTHGSQATIEKHVDNKDEQETRSKDYLTPTGHKKNRAVSTPDSGVRKRGHNNVHKKVWTQAIDTTGYVRCHLQNCDFMALTLGEMIEHYRSCNLFPMNKGDKLYECPHCKGKVLSEFNLSIHIIRSHGDDPGLTTSGKQLILRHKEGVQILRFNIEAPDTADHQVVEGHSSDDINVDIKPLLSDDCTRLVRSTNQSYTISKDEVEILIPTENAFDNSVTDPLMQPTQRVFRISPDPGASEMKQSLAASRRRLVMKQEAAGCAGGEMNIVRGQPLNQPLNQPLKQPLKQGQSGNETTQLSSRSYEHRLFKEEPSSGASTALSTLPRLPFQQTKVTTGATKVPASPPIHFSPFQGTKRKVCSFWKGAYVPKKVVHVNKKVCTFWKNTPLIKKSRPVNVCKEDEEPTVSGVETLHGEVSQEQQYSMQDFEVIQECEINTAPVEYIISDMEYVEGDDKPHDADQTQETDQPHVEDQSQYFLPFVKRPETLPQPQPSSEHADVFLINHIDHEVPVKQVEMELPIEHTEPKKIDKPQDAYQSQDEVQSQRFLAFKAQPEIRLPEVASEPSIEHVNELQGGEEESPFEHEPEPKSPIKPAIIALYARQECMSGDVRSDLEERLTEDVERRTEEHVTNVLGNETQQMIGELESVPQGHTTEKSVSMREEQRTEIPGNEPGSDTRGYIIEVPVTESQEYVAIEMASGIQEHRMNDPCETPEHKTEYIERETEYNMTKDLGGATQRHEIEVLESESPEHISDKLGSKIQEHLTEVQGNEQSEQFAEYPVSESQECVAQDLAAEDLESTLRKHVPSSVKECKNVSEELESTNVKQELVIQQYKIQECGEVQTAHHSVPRLFDAEEGEVLQTKQYEGDEKEKAISTMADEQSHSLPVRLGDSVPRLFDAEEEQVLQTKQYEGDEKEKAISTMADEPSHSLPVRQGDVADISTVNGEGVVTGKMDLLKRCMAREGAEISVIPPSVSTDTRQLHDSISQPTTAKCYSNESSVSRESALPISEPVVCNSEAIQSTSDSVINRAQVIQPLECVTNAVESLKPIISDCAMYSIEPLQPLSHSKTYSENALVLPNDHRLNQIYSLETQSVALQPHSVNSIQSINDPVNISIEATYQGSNNNINMDTANTQLDDNNLKCNSKKRKRDKSKRVAMRDKTLKLEVNNGQCYVPPLDPVASASSQGRVTEVSVLSADESGDVTDAHREPIRGKRGRSAKNREDTLPTFRTEKELKETGVQEDVTLLLTKMSERPTEKSNLDDSDVVRVAEPALGFMEGNVLEELTNPVETIGNAKKVIKHNNSVAIVQSGEISEDELKKRQQDQVKPLRQNIQCVVQENQSKENVSEVSESSDRGGMDSTCLIEEEAVLTEESKDVSKTCERGLQSVEESSVKQVEVLANVKGRKKILSKKGAIPSVDKMQDNSSVGTLKSVRISRNTKKKVSNISEHSIDNSQQIQNKDVHSCPVVPASVDVTNSTGKIQEEEENKETGSVSEYQNSDHQNGKSRGRQLRKSLDSIYNSVPVPTVTGPTSNTQDTNIKENINSSVLVNNSNSENIDEGKETVPPLKKKRGRPPKKSLVSALVDLLKPIDEADHHTTETSEETLNNVAPTSTMGLDSADLETLDKGKTVVPSNRKKRGRASKESVVPSQVDGLKASEEKDNVGTEIIETTQENIAPTVNPSSSLVIDNLDLETVETVPPIKKKRGRPPKKSLAPPLINLSKPSEEESPGDTATAVEDVNLLASTENLTSVVNLSECNTDSESLPLVKKKGRRLSKGVDVNILKPSEDEKITSGNPDIVTPIGEGNESTQLLGSEERCTEDIPSVKEILDNTAPIKKKKGRSVKRLEPSSAGLPETSRDIDHDQESVPKTKQGRGKASKKCPVSSIVNLPGASGVNESNSVERTVETVATTNEEQDSLAMECASSSLSSLPQCSTDVKKEQESTPPITKKRGRPSKKSLLSSENNVVATSVDEVASSGTLTAARPTSKRRSKHVVTSDATGVTSDATGVSVTSDQVSNSEAVNPVSLSLEPPEDPPAMDDVQSKPIEVAPTRFSSRGRQLKPKQASYEEDQILSDDNPSQPLKGTRLRSKRANSNGSDEVPKRAKRLKVLSKTDAPGTSAAPDKPASSGDRAGEVGTPAGVEDGGSLAGEDQEAILTEEVDTSGAEDTDGFETDAASSSPTKKKKKKKANKKKQQRLRQHAKLTLALERQVNKVKSVYAEAEDAVEQEQGPLTPESVINCGKCGLEMNYSKFNSHCKTAHSGLAWVQGYPPLDMSDMEHVRYLLLKVWKHKDKKQLLCETCGSVRRSIEGFISHLELTCDKSFAEQEALKVMCTVCGRYMMKSSLKVHMGTTHKTGLPEEATDEPQLMRGLGKRAAATKAGNLLQECMREEKEDGANHTEAEVKLYKRASGSHPLISTVITRARKEIQRNGKTSCCNAGCSFVTTELEAVREHFSSCAWTPAVTYHCKLCSFSTVSEDAIKDHTKTKHADADISNLDSDFAGNSGGSDVEGSVDSATQPRRRNQTILSLVKPTKYTTQVKFLTDEFSDRIRGNRPYNPAAKWTLKFHSENYLEMLFPKLRSTRDDWLSLSETEAALHLPTTQESVPVTHVLNENTVRNPHKQYNELNWKCLKLFEAMIVDGVPVFYAGGPVWAMAWLPIPNQVLVQATTNISQMLAVSCHRNMDDVYNVKSSCAGPGLIQLWQFSQLDNTKCTEAPTMVLGLAHDFGTVWHLEWCPSGCYEVLQEHPERLSRIGLLAAACSDGAVHIFSVPLPAQLQPSAHNVYATTPVVSLHLSRAVATAMCTRVSWQRSKGHRYVTASYSDGMVAVWDLETTSPFLTEIRDRVRVIYPHIAFQAHLGSITALSLCPYGGFRYLMSGGTDRFTKVWDLVQTPPVVISSSLKGCVTDGAWLMHWTSTISSYDDGYGIQHTNSMLQPIRNFGYTPYPFLAQNSPVLSVTASDWSNAVAHGTQAGEVCVIFPHQLFIGVDTEKSMKDKRMVVSYIEMVEPSAETSRTNDDAVQADDDVVNTNESEIEAVKEECSLDVTLSNDVSIPSDATLKHDSVNVPSVVSTSTCDTNVPNIMRRMPDNTSVLSALSSCSTIAIDNIVVQTTRSYVDNTSLPKIISTTPNNTSSLHVASSSIIPDSVRILQTLSPISERMDVEEEEDEDFDDSKSITDSVATCRASSASTSMFGGSKDVSFFDGTEDGEAEDESFLMDDSSALVANIQTNPIHKERLMLPEVYADVAKRFKLAFCNFPLDNFRKIPQEAWKWMRMSEKMRTVPVEMYPITSVNKVLWNPNCSSHLWLAAGYQCGFVRVPCMWSMHNKYTDTLLKTTFS